MSGKGDKWRQTDFKKYFDAELWDTLEWKKQFECYRCDESWRCENRYRSKECQGFQ